MNYKQAKQLKDAGFPQYTVAMGDAFYDENKEYRVEVSGCSVFNKHKDIRIPSLEELIDACGDSVGIFKVSDTESNAWSKKLYLDNNIMFKGKTPLEAVAKLYIELNKK